MARRAIDPAELTVGQPLRFNAYDAKGVLLLRMGQVIGSAAQLDRLVRHGLFFGSEDECRAVAAPPAPSPLAAVLDARERLQRLLADVAPIDFLRDLNAIGALVRRACQGNPDVALASIMLRPEGPYGTRHAVNVAIACQLIGQADGMDPAGLAVTVAAALTMNIGMFSLHQELHALEGPLSDAQHAAVRAHCTGGVQQLRDRGVTSADWLEAVRDHHERSDGSGYPAGKRGEEIGHGARLLAMADVYCARVSGRDYRPPLPPPLALRWLFLNEGAVLDEHLAKVFIKTLGIYPPGTGVRLRNGSIAVVIQRGPASHTPRVASLTTNDGILTGAPIRRRVDVEAHAVSEVVDLHELGLTVSMEALWGADAVA